VFDSKHKHDPYAAFRYSSYRIYVFGWVIALLGLRIQTVAIGWEMYQRTGEALSLGLVGLAQAIPTMLFALPAGYLADRFDRRRLLILSLWGMLLSSSALATFSYMQGSVTWMYILLFLDASAVMLGRPARTALLPQLLPSEIFPNAVTWNMSMQHMASVIGPAIGGFIVAYNVPSAYVIAAISSFIFLLMLTQLQLSSAGPRRVGQASFQSLLAGLKFVSQARLILIVITLDLFAVLLGGAVYLLPIFAQDILHVGASGFGWLQAAPAAGAFCMALCLAYLPPMKRAGRDLLLAVAGFGVATIIFGLSTSFWLSFAMLFLTGLFDNISMVIRHTLMQLLTPDQMRGRVSAVTTIFIGASNELGGLESGVVAQWLGPVFSVVSGGIGTLIVVALTALAAPQLRTFGALHEAKPIEPVEEKTAAMGSEV
jgi:MFS family permease